MIHYCFAHLISFYHPAPITDNPSAAAIPNAAHIRPNPINNFNPMVLEVSSPEEPVVEEVEKDEEEDGEKGVLEYFCGRVWWFWRLGDCALLVWRVWYSSRSHMSVISVSVEV